MTNPTQPAHPPVDALLERSIRDIDIPPRPQIIDRIRHEMHRDEPDMFMVGRLISRDVSLAAGLIKTANSPYFGFSLRVRSVNEALMMLGLDAASRAIAAISLHKAFPDSAHYERFWHASAEIAALSGWLAQHLAVPCVRADDAYTFGLFRDCGIVILLRRFGSYRDILMRANRDGERLFTDHELDTLPTHHAVVGSLLAQNWWLPEVISQAIRNHHDPAMLDRFDSGLPLASRRLVAIAQTAERLVQAATGGSQTREWDKLGPSCLRLLDLDDEALDGLVEPATQLLRRID
jgi:HD-like signal output (HDOD) protein